MFADLLAVRLVELGFAIAWIVGFVLVWRTTRRTFLVGLYLGATLSFSHDWVLGGPTLWDMTFADDTVLLGTWGGRQMAVWSPVSYGSFFGIFAWLWLRYAEPRLAPRLASWRYALVFPAIYVLNVVVEGGMIELSDANTYHLDDRWVLLNIPWLHLFTTGTFAAVLVWIAVQSLRVLEFAGWRELDAPGSALQREVPRPVRVGIFSLGLAVPHVAFTAGTIVTILLYDAIGVHAAP